MFSSLQFSFAGLSQLSIFVFLPSDAAFSPGLQAGHGALLGLPGLIGVLELPGLLGLLGLLRAFNVKLDFRFPLTTDSSAAVFFSSEKPFVKRREGKGQLFY